MKSQSDLLSMIPMYYVNNRNRHPRFREVYRKLKAYTYTPTELDLFEKEIIFLLKESHEEVTH